MKKLVILLVSVSFLFGCSRTGSVDVKSEEEALKKLEADWGEMILKKDVDAIVDLFAPDAVIMAPDMELISGREQIRKMMEVEVKDSAIIWETLKWDNEKVEVSASGDMGYVMGRSTFKVKTLWGELDLASKGLEIFKKIDGKWKVLLTVSNSVKPDKEIMAPLSTVEVFTKIENDWNMALYKKDIKALENLYAKEYTYTDNEGKVYTREQDLKEVMTQNYKATSPGVIKEIMVDAYGTVAVVKGLVEVKAVQGGKNISGLNRFVDVFVFRDFRWQCVSTQSSRVSGR